LWKTNEQGKQQGFAVMPVLLITGANRGLGLEFVRQFLGDGWDVIATCRDPNKADELTALGREHGDKLIVDTMDVNEDQSVYGLADKLDGRQVDLLINNAGMVDKEAYGSGAYEGHDDPDLKNYDFDQWLDVIKTNLMSPARVTAAFRPHLERGTNPIVVMVGSTLSSVALTTDPGRYSYRTSKAALNSLMRGMGAWLKTRGITCLTISPGWTRTEMGGPKAKNSVEQSVIGVRKVIAGITPKDAGKFYDYDGSEIPW
jgi:NAD(P)-dependent dehydrogenase (short-subunit alcohol dehydrogenase family)